MRNIIIWILVILLVGSMAWLIGASIYLSYLEWDTHITQKARFLITWKPILLIIVSSFFIVVLMKKK